MCCDSVDEGAPSATPGMVQLYPFYGRMARIYTQRRAADPMNLVKTKKQAPGPADRRVRPGHSGSENNTWRHPQVNVLVRVTSTIACLRILRGLERTPTQIYNQIHVLDNTAFVRNPPIPVV